MLDVKDHKVDYHIHTFYSDGQASPESVVKRAAQLGYEEIAITDHDVTGGVEEAVNAGKRAGIQVVTGIELATETEDGIGLHMLGYGFDVKDAHFCETLEELRKRRNDRNLKLIGVLQDMGYDITIEELLVKQPNGFIGKPVIARTLVEKGYIDDYTEAFKNGRIFASPEARAVKKVKILASDAVSLIRDAGGVAVLAHPIQTRKVGKTGSEEFYANMRNIIGTLAEQGLSGLECYHPDQDVYQTKRFVEMAGVYGLKITRGSDFHGIDFADAEPTA